MAWPDACSSFPAARVIAIGRGTYADMEAAGAIMDLMKPSPAARPLEPERAPSPDVRPFEDHLEAQETEAADEPRPEPASATAQDQAAPDEDSETAQPALAAAPPPDQAPAPQLLVQIVTQPDAASTAAAPASAAPATEAPSSDTAPVEAAAPAPPAVAQPALQSADAAPADAAPTDASAPVVAPIIKTAANDTPAPAQQSQVTPQPEAAAAQPDATAAAQQTAPTATPIVAPPAVQAVAQANAAAEGDAAPAIEPGLARGAGAKESIALTEADAKDSGKAEAAAPKTGNPAATPQAFAPRDGVKPPATPAPDTQAPAPQAAAPIAPAPTSGAQSTHHAAAIDSASRAAPAAHQVGREIVRRFNGENTRFELRLDPPELGRVEVRLEVSRDNRVTAIVAADNPQALSELSRGARELEQALQSAGLDLSEDGLSFDLTDQRQRFTDDDQSKPRGLRDSEAEPAATPVSARPLGLDRWRGVRVDLVA